MRHDDLKGYRTKVDRALEGTYRGRKIYTTHAPTAGPALIHILNLIEQYGDEIWNEGRIGLNVHRSVEAMKCACVDSGEYRTPSQLNISDGFAAR